jgi:RimJ/RimL family protein N-acetyltransferase
MRFTFTEDYGLVRTILTDAKCFRRMKNDTAPPIERFSVGPTPGIRYVIADEGGCAAAVFLLVTMGNVPIGAAEVHFCILPEWWGYAVKIGAAFLEWAWAHTSVMQLLGPVPGYNPLALKTAEAVGFTVRSRDLQSVRKNGEMYDIIHTEVTRPNQHAANATAGA